MFRSALKNTQEKPKKKERECITSFCKTMGDWQFTTNNQTGEIICTNCGKVQEKVALDSGIDFNEKGAVGKFIHSGIGK